MHSQTAANNSTESLQIAGLAAQQQTRTLAVLQPGYLPWLGFFEQVKRASTFVIYDDVQFDKNGWRNRNRIKGNSGPIWLTVPVHGSTSQKICEVRIDNKLPWRRKHLSSIEMNYKKAPYYELYMPRLKEIFAQDWDFIAELDMVLIEQLCKWLEIGTPLVRSSSLTVAGDRNSKLVNLCKTFNCQTYFSGAAAQDYLDQDLFKGEGIQVEWQDFKHPVYQQMHGEFIPFLSVLDLLLNCGPESKELFSTNQPE